MGQVASTYASATDSVRLCAAVALRAFVNPNEGPHP
jgi:hypothetical protein